MAVTRGWKDGEEGKEINVGNEDHGGVEATEEFTWLSNLAEACLHGCDAVLVRSPSSSRQSRTRMASLVKKALGTSRTKLIVGDGDLDAAAAVRADGIHFPQRLIQLGFADQVQSARKVLGAAALVGASAHDLEAVGRAAEAGADYLLLGTIFPTSSHPEKVRVEGLSLVQETRLAFPQVMCIGIGGIDDGNCDRVIQSGANGVAVVSYILDAEDPASAVKRMKARMLGALALPV
eukprot:767070-Hanusia_phi.AAC.2